MDVEARSLGGGLDVAVGAETPPPPVSALSGRPGTAVASVQADLDALVGAWDDLWNRNPAATAFQSHAWITAWARAYVPDGQLAVVTVWNGDVLVAAAPLYRMRRGPMVVLAPLGGSLSDSTDVLIDPQVPDAGARLVSALLRLRGWRVLDLPEVVPGSAAQSWAQSWPGRVRRAPSSLNLQLPVLPVADVIARIPVKTAGKIRRKLNKIDKLGIERVELLPAAVSAAVDELIRLHEAQWAGRRGNPEHLTERFRTFLGSALEPMVGRGQAVMAEYRLDGRLMASDIHLVGHRQLSYYLPGIDPELRQYIDTSVLLVSRGLELAGRLGSAEYSFLRGDEDYKLHWRPDRVTAERVVLARPGLLGSGGYFPVSAASSAVMALARRLLAGHARELARAVMHRVRQVRATG